VNVRRALLLLLVAVIAVVVAACGVRKVQRSISAAKVGTATGWKGGPIHVRKGDKVVIRVGNLTDKEHGFSIDAFGVKDTVKPGQHVSARFTPTRTGHFTIYCQLHPAHLKTELNVT
jgi:heme/copper-type cytochrome/quinol oxidase subunit 2